MEPIDSFEEMPSQKSARLAPPRRDAMALGFGAAFVGLGLLGLLRAAGLEVPTAWLYAAVLIGVGAAGLLSSRARAS